MVWFHGSQSSITPGGSSGWRTRAIWPMAMLAHIISCVFTTALGMPVEPEVNRNLPMVLPSIAAIDRLTASVGVVDSSAAKGVDCKPGGASSTCTRVTPSSRPAASSEASALANIAPFCTKIIAGRISLTM